MQDFVTVLNMLGLTQIIAGLLVAFGAIALYFGFIKKS
jgi:hypothetical protein